MLIIGDVHQLQHCQSHPSQTIAKTADSLSQSIISINTRIPHSPSPSGYAVWTMVLKEVRLIRFYLSPGNNCGTLKEAMSIKWKSILFYCDWISVDQLCSPLLTPLPPRNCFRLLPAPAAGCSLPPPPSYTRAPGDCCRRRLSSSLTTVKQKSSGSIDLHPNP